MNFMNREQEEQQNKGMVETQNTRSPQAGVINNPCGAPVCAKNSIDPEEFLSECFAPVCWDCWFVSQKIQL